ncbi:MAG TPA: hypothetical protein VF395_04035 [Polyangiaceae bacterium]
MRHTKYVSVAQLVLGALNVGSRVIAEGKNAKKARTQVGETIDRLVPGLQKRKGRGR